MTKTVSTPSAAINPPAQPQVQNQNNTPSSTPTPVVDNSNAGLQAQLSDIDTQINGFASDTASVNQSMNDQPVSQSQF
jgi:hypothetical protein